MEPNDYSSYMEELKAALTGLSIHVMPADMLGSWESLLEECIEGYGYTLYEFDDEMAVRSDIEKLLHADRLKDYEQFQFFVSAVEEIDVQIKEHVLLNVLPVDVTYWWEGCLPKRATKTLIENVRSHFGEDVIKEIELVG